VLACTREHVSEDWKKPVASDYPTLRKWASDKGSGDSAESMFFSLFLSVLDRIIRRWPSLSFEQMRRVNVQVSLFGIQIVSGIGLYDALIKYESDKGVGWMTSVWV
jgi:hypothetical protein